jgi:hypothetical protein
MGRYDEGGAGFIPGLRIEITRACFHTVEKKWVRRTVLKIWARGIPLAEEDTSRP